MTTIRKDYLRAAYPLLPGMRSFALSWDNSRSRKVGPGKAEKQEATGVKFATGRVALDNGATYESIGEMETLLGLAGVYRIDWQKDEHAK